MALKEEAADAETVAQTRKPPARCQWKMPAEKSVHPIFIAVGRPNNRLSGAAQNAVTGLLFSFAEGPAISRTTAALRPSRVKMSAQ
jgi:hypothetical protein